MADLQEIQIPNIGGATDVDVIEVLVSPGDQIAIDDSILTLETEKASMEVPAPMAGEVAEVKVNVGDKVSEGDVVVLLKASEAVEKPSEETQAKPQPVKSEVPKPTPKPSPVQAPLQTSIPRGEVHAAPAVRRIAREFGVDLSKVTGSGHKDRILKTDVQDYVKSRLQGQETGGLAVPAMPKIDFSQFGEIEVKPLNKIKRLTGVYVHRSWVTVPHVTHFDEADITEMEEFRKLNKAYAEKQGAKLTPLVFIMKAVISGLKAFPNFNASLDPSGTQLILKKYYL